MISAEELAAVEQMVTQVHAVRRADGRWEASMRLVTGACVTVLDKISMWDAVRAARGEASGRGRRLHGWRARSMKITGWTMVILGAVMMGITAHDLFEALLITLGATFVDAGNTVRRMRS